MLHAAQALIFERTDRVAKTHRGVKRQFHRLAPNEAGLDPELPSSLSNAYRLKQTADYEIGDLAPVTSSQATEALSAAERFVSQVRQVLDPPPSS
jgi:uncharacterized protein (UPF0332 family)